MATEIVLPKFGNTVEECIISQWCKDAGDMVAVDELLCEVETDKTTMEVNSTTTGVLRHLFYVAGDVVPVMRVIALVGTAEENIDALVAEHNKSIENNNPENNSANESAQQVAAVIDSAEQPPYRHDHVKQRVATTVAPLRCTPRAKTYLAGKGLTAEQFLRHFPASREQLSVVSTDDEQSRVGERAVRAFFASISPLSLSAIEKLIAQDALLTIQSGSGIGGRIMARDIVDLPAASFATAIASPADRTAPVVLTTAREKRRVSLGGMRRIISERMLHSLRSSAQVTLTGWADARRLKQARAQYKKASLSVTINDMILSAVAKVLIDNSWANSLLVDKQLIEYEEVHLGCAVQTDRGLMVPVIEHASKKGMADISKEIKELASQCKEGVIAPNLLQGGTFTVSNLGALGVQSFTPILNVPQTGILGIGAIELRAIENEESADGIEFCPSLNLSLTFDHCAYDGAKGAELLWAFATAIAEVEYEGER